MCPSVLIVEDDDDIRDTVRDILHRHGFQVICATNGRAALDLLMVVERPSVILLDLMMPIMGGEEFIEVLENNCQLRSIPIVICTASGPPLTALAFGNGHLRLDKPFTEKALVETVSLFAASRMA
jgi:CheY-like chemotaxis protein